MRRMRTLICGTALMTLALLVPAGAASASPTRVRPGTSYSFALVTPNTAVAPIGGMMAGPGDWIEVTGGGLFNTATGTIEAGGAFAHHRVDGTLACAGTWRATALTGWRDFSAARSRRHGGIVSMLVTHSCDTTGEIHTQIPMTVTSTRHAPDDGTTYVEGVTVGEFTQSTGGTVAIRAMCRRS